MNECNELMRQTKTIAGFAAVYISLHYLLPPPVFKHWLLVFHLLTALGAFAIGGYLTLCFGQHRESWGRCVVSSVLTIASAGLVAYFGYLDYTHIYR